MTALGQDAATFRDSRRRLGEEQLGAAADNPTTRRRPPFSRLSHHSPAPWTRSFAGCTWPSAKLRGDASAGKNSSTPSTRASAPRRSRPRGNRLATSLGPPSGPAMRIWSWALSPLAGTSANSTPSTTTGAASRPNVLCSRQRSPMCRGRLAPPGLAGQKHSVSPRATAWSSPKAPTRARFLPSPRSRRKP